MTCTDTAPPPAPRTAPTPILSGWVSRGDYHWQHEPCWYAVRARGRALEHGDDLRLLGASADGDRLRGTGVV